ncbi:MAG: LicD family protein [Mogibacterium sp.]|nr:LicD family protein [Mogibacterium sp.]
MSSKRLQSILVQLLREIDEVCRANDIRYYLCGGTCIGQIRHGGFVPWDDDIDIFMPRKDYEKFEEVISKNMPEGRDLVSFSRYNTYTNPVPRYMDLSTTAIRSGRLGDGTVCGECIEIFILDPMPRDEKERDEWKKLQYVYCELLTTGWIQGKRRYRKKYVDIDLYNKYRKKAAKVGRLAVLAELEEKLFNIDEKDSDIYCYRWTPRSLFEMPIKCYGTPKDVIYEGMHVLTLERPAEYLQLYIGYTWRNLLAPEDRGIHPTRINHDLAAGNCEREFLQIVSEDEYNRIFQHHKDESMEYYRLRNLYFRDRLDPAMKYAVAKSKAEFARYGKEALSKDTKLALKAFGEYIKLQRNATLRDNDIAIPLDNEIVDLVADAMFREHMVQQLFQILHVRHKNVGNGIELTELQEQYYRDCKDFLKMVVHIDEGEYEEAESYCKMLGEKYPDHLWIYRCKMRLAIERAVTPEDYTKMAELGEEALKLYPEDDCINKRYADALLALSRKDEAEKIYHKVSRESINGLLLREMKEYGIEEAALKLDAKVWKFDE